MFSKASKLARKVAAKPSSTKAKTSSAAKPLNKGMPILQPANDAAYSYDHAPMAMKKKFAEVIYPNMVGAPTIKLEEYTGEKYYPHESVIGFRYIADKEPKVVINGTVYDRINANSGWTYFGSVITVGGAVDMMDDPKRRQKFMLAAKARGHKYFLHTENGRLIPLQDGDQVFNDDGRQIWPAFSSHQTNYPARRVAA